MCSVIPPGTPCVKQLLKLSSHKLTSQNSEVYYPAGGLNEKQTKGSELRQVRKEATVVILWLCLEIKAAILPSLQGVKDPNLEAHLSPWNIS